MILHTQIYCVDRVPERLQKAASFGCIPIDFSKGDAVDQIIAANGGMVDRFVVLIYVLAYFAHEYTLDPSIA